MPGREDDACREVSAPVVPAELPSPPMLRHRPRGDQGEHLPLSFVIEAALCRRRAHLHHVAPMGGPVPSDDEEAPPPLPAGYVRRVVSVACDDLAVTADLDLLRPEAGSQDEFARLPEVANRLAPADLAAVAALVAALARRAAPALRSVVRWVGGRLLPVETAAEDLPRARRLVAAAAELALQPRADLPLTLDPACEDCRFTDVCLPDETAALAGRIPPGSVRRLVPARDDRRPLYVQAYDLKVGVSQGRLVVRRGKEVVEDVPLAEVSQLCLVGGAQVTTQALRTCFAEQIPVFFFTGSGWFMGRAMGEPPGNVPLRLAQARALGDRAISLAAARTFVCDKIHNARVFLRRNARALDRAVLDQLTRLERQAKKAPDLAALRGYEGRAARTYFGAWNACLDPARGFRATGRTKRPPRDPVNAMLSYCYGVLVRDWVLACHVVGLDPMIGVYHQPLWGRPALALDLMEPSRPWVADSVVLRLINNGEVRPEHFERAGDVVQMAPQARRALLRAYERRVDGLHTHPVFGYRISVRRTFEVQARLFARWLLGEIPEYRGIRVR